MISKIQLKGIEHEIADSNARENKADKNGTYPELTAGTAQNLLGNVEITNDSAYRPTGGDNDVNSGYEAASIESIKGNARAWNQLAPMITNDNYTDYEYGNAIVNVVNGEANVTVVDYSHAYWHCTKYKNDKKIPLILGHKYLASLELYRNVIQPADSVGIEIQSNASWYDKELPANKWNKVSVITEYDNYSEYLGHNSVLLLRMRTPFSDEDNTYKVRKLQLFDLTLIYGAGNEPSTPEEFEADYQRWFGRTLEYEEYDEGSIRSVKATGIKTVGFNLSPINEFKGDAFGWYHLNNNCLWKNDCNYKGQLYLSFDLISSSVTQENAPDNARVDPSLAVYYKDGTIGYIRGTAIFCKVSGITLANKEVEKISCEGYSYSGDIDVKNISINFVWSGKRNGEYEPHWEETVPIPITTLSSGGKVIFPDGLKRAGNVYDEIKIENGVTKAIKRVGSVDLGSLDWHYKSDWGAFSSLDLNGLMAMQPVPRNLLVSKKYKINNNGTIWGTAGIDLILDGGRVSFYDDKAALQIIDFSYGTDANALKESLQGIILYYELAFPEEYIIDNFQLPLAYKIDDFGTEQILMPNDSITPICNIKYGINAVDTVRRMPARIEEVKNSCLSLDGGKMNNNNLVQNLNADYLKGLSPESFTPIVNFSGYDQKYVRLGIPDTQEWGLVTVHIEGLPYGGADYKNFIPYDTTITFFITSNQVSPYSTNAINKGYPITDIAVGKYENRFCVFFKVEDYSSIGIKAFASFSNSGPLNGNIVHNIAAYTGSFSTNTIPTEATDIYHITPTNVVKSANELKVEYKTASEFESLTSKDANTLYFITED